MRSAVDSGPLRVFRSKPNVTATVFYAVLSVAFYAPGLLPGHTTSGADLLWFASPWTSSRPPGVPPMGSNPALVDTVTVFEPFLQYTRSQLPHIPLWNPYIMLGAPFLADMQSAIFSPFSLPAYILPFWWSLSLIAVLKVFVAATGAFFLARALRMRFAGALLAGVVYGFGLFMISWVPWPVGSVFAFVPWLAFATERVVRRPGVLAACFLAVVVTMQFFAGHPESSFHALFATSAFFVLRVCQGRTGLVAAVRRATAEGRARWRALYEAAKRPVSTFVVALALGAMLAAVVLVPFAEFVHNSSDLTARPRGSVYVPAKDFFAVFMPGYFPGTFQITTAFYAGALPLMLALVALLRPKVERIAIAAFAFVCVAVVLGIQPFFGIVRRLPGFDASYNTRLTIMYLLAVALLAGWGACDLLYKPLSRREKRAVAAIGVGVLLIPPVVVVATRATSTRYFGRAWRLALDLVKAPRLAAPGALGEIHLASLIVWLIVAVAALSIIWLRISGRIAAPVFAVLAVALVVGDLFQAGFDYYPAIPTANAEQPATAAIRYLQQRSPARFVAVEPYVGNNALPPNVNMRYDLYDARGYDFPVETRFGRLWTTYVAPPTPLLPLDTAAVPQLDLELRPVTLRVLSLLGVRSILQPTNEQSLRLPGLRLTYDGRDAKIYTNSSAMPRTWLVSRQQVVGDDSEALTTIAAAGFDARAAVVTDTPIPGIQRVQKSSAASAGGASANGSARLAQYQAQRVVIDANAKRTSVLVLSDLDYPGWRATVDGKPVPIDRVDYLFRGVTLSPGNHQVVFTYDPASFRVGWILSLVAALSIVTCVCATFAVRRRRRTQPRRTQPRHLRSNSLNLGKR